MSAGNMIDHWGRAVRPNDSLKNLSVDGLVVT